MRDGDTAPRQQRPDTGEQHQRERERNRVAVEPGRAEAGSLTGDRLRDEREEGAPEDDEAEADEREVVEQEYRLAREQRVEPPRRAEVVEPRHDQGDRA